MLGTVRTLWLAPHLGTVGAVAAELPVMLAASWIWARVLLVRMAPASQDAALASGLAALVLLLAAEAVIGIGLLGIPARTWLAGFTTPPGVLGLAGQIAFCLLPFAVIEAINRRRVRFASPPPAR